MAAALSSSTIIRSRRIPPDLEDRLFRKLQMIDDATEDSDLLVPPSNHFEKLEGTQKGLPFPSCQRTHPVKAAGCCYAAFDDRHLLAPVPGSSSAMRWADGRQAGEDIGEPSLRVDVVELGGLDEGVDSGGVAARSEPANVQLLRPNRDAAQRPFGRVVGDTHTTVIEEARERCPALETVVDRLGGLVLRGEFSLCAQPGFDSVISGRLRSWRTRTLVWRGAVDLALDREQRIDAVDSLNGDWRLLEPRQFEELAPELRPACRLDDRPRLAARFVEPVEPA